jgi:hypothetical protein
MARSAAGNAERAADALEAFLRDRPVAAVSADPDEALASSQEGKGALGDDAGLPPQRRTRQADPAAVQAFAAGTPLRLPHTDWLFHRLMVTGPAAAVAAFRAAASGAGTIPWPLDADSLEEDWFHLLVNPAHRALSLAGARVLAGLLREAVERRHAIAVAGVGHSRACLFDLHALVPVPAAILVLGPDHPDALAWLWQHWGTTQALRHVAPDTAPTRAPASELAAGEDRLRLSFWSADWTPWRAFGRTRVDWPALHFDVQPKYDVT